MNKKAFSLVEMIVVITIIILLGVIVSTINTNFKTKTLNTRSTADLSTLENAFNVYLEENKTLPDPTGNTNYFKQDTSYADGEAGSFGVYGQVTGNTLPKKYLNFLPLDQFTGAFYAYGTLTDKSEFEVSGVIRESGNAVSIVKGNYSAESGPYNLIREYNGPNFVYDGSSTYFPYNPEELSLNARITEFSGNVTINGNAAAVNQVLTENDEVIVPINEQATLYFGDGSKSILGDSVETKLTLKEMSHPDDNSLMSQIALVLNAGTIWTNATQMGAGSEFTIQTGDSTAAVRGTIFGVNYNTATNTTTIDVESGTVTATGAINGGIIFSTGGIILSSTNSATLTAADNKIKNGYGELTSTLKTEVVSYDATTKKVILEMNEVFKYDADYLQAGSIQIRNDDNSWVIPEHEFDLTTVPGDEVILKFCTDEGVCTRETSVAKNLSYITEEVNGTITCSATSNTQDTRVYSLSNAPEGSAVSSDTYEETDTNDHKVYTYSLTANCGSGGLFTNFNETQDFTRCESGYPIDTGSVCRVAYACSSGTQSDGYTLTAEILHGADDSVTKDVPITNGTQSYSATANCSDGDLTISNSNPTLLACDAGYDPIGGACITIPLACMFEDFVPDGTYSYSNGMFADNGPQYTFSATGGLNAGTILQTHNRILVASNETYLSALSILKKQITVQCLLGATTELPIQFVIALATGDDFIGCTAETGWTFSNPSKFSTYGTIPFVLDSIPYVLGGSSNHDVFKHYYDTGNPTTWTADVKMKKTTTNSCTTSGFTYGAEQFISAEYKTVTPGTTLLSLHEGAKVDLNGNYTIEMNLNGSNMLASNAIQYIFDTGTTKLLNIVVASNIFEKIVFNSLELCNDLSVTKCNISSSSIYKINISYNSTSVSNGDYIINILDGAGNNLFSKTTNGIKGLFNTNMHIGSKTTGTSSIPNGSINNIVFTK